LLQAGPRLPSILAFSGVRPLLTKIIKEAYGNDWHHTLGSLPMPDDTSDQQETPKIVMFATTLDGASVDFAREAGKYGKVIGTVALLDLQRGSRTELQRAGVKNVSAVITLQHILRYALRGDRLGISQREGIKVLRSLNTQETQS